MKFPAEVSSEGQTKNVSCRRVPLCGDEKCGINIFKVILGFQVLI